MESFQRKKYVIIYIVIIVVVFISGISLCIHLPPRSQPGNDAITLFIQAGKPGSELHLFENNSLNGWYPVGIGHWKIKNGVLSIRHGLGYLATQCDTIRDFRLSLQIKTAQKANSGIFFRAGHPHWDFRPWPEGYEAQIDNHDPKNPTGSLYNRSTATGMRVADGEWFTMQVTAIGPAIDIKLNGETVVSATNTDYHAGFLALQAHGPSSYVEYKDIHLQIPTLQAEQ